MSITEQRPYLMMIAWQYVLCTNLKNDMNDNTDNVFHYIVLYYYAE